MKRITSTVAVLSALALAACGNQTASQETSKSEALTTPGVLAADPWIRTTDGSQMPSMTALFVNLTNPTDKNIVLESANCGDVAKMVELHEMAKVDGKMVMRKMTTPYIVPKQSHAHMVPGGPHVMLMGLTRKLPAGSEEIKCTLSFDNGQKVELSAPIKQVPEDQAPYHTHAPGDSTPASTPS